MKKYTTVIILLLVTAIVYWSFYAQMPNSYGKSNKAETLFSTERALVHVQNMSKAPHFVGTEAHEDVRNYLLSELKKMGLQAGIQEGMTAGNWGNLSKATNILARIEGTGKGKALLVLSHYDSNPHSSPGASDAASGIATVLEGIRAFLAQGTPPKNDIIILLSDAEELGLNGAELFVNKHPWAKNTGLVFNFEARGSGGPSIMLIETNGGNAKMIKQFVQANPSYPVANSLAYSIYKLLPNDTDLTVFREDGNIEGFNFAFIDDHYDYHTALDTYERLDRTSLEHQGSYLMPLLDHFAKADLSDLRDKEDYVYFTVPLFNMVYYPFSWATPLFIAGLLIFIGILFFGFKQKSLSFKSVAIGFVPFVITFLLCCAIGFYSWTALTALYPQYQDILHRFTYNGHTYIAAFSTLFIAIGFLIYTRFKHISAPNLFVAPLFFWLLICGLTTFYLKGASFFIFPLFASLVMLYIVTIQEKPLYLLLVLLAVPSLWILSPFIQLFPVGLGLGMRVGTLEFSPLVLSALLIVFLLGLQLPLFGFLKQTYKLGLFGLLLALVFFTSAHFDSGFDKNSPRPTSLVYMQDNDHQKAFWATYDKVPDEWVKQYVGAKPVTNEEASKYAFSSKYATRFSQITETTVKDIPAPLVEIVQDSVFGEKRFLELCITPRRNVNRLEVFINKDAQILSCQANGVALEAEFLSKVPQYGRLLTHYISNNAYTELLLEIPADQKTQFTFYEASNDLLQNRLFTVPERPENTIPKPFVLNDAIITKKTLSIE